MALISFYEIFSITPSGGSGNFDYNLDNTTTLTGELTTDGVNDGDKIFEFGEVLTLTYNGTVYAVTYNGFADINANSDADFGVFTVTAVMSGPDTDGLLGLQFGYTSDGSVPSATARGKALNPLIGTPICFASGTMIRAKDGPVAVEDIKPGDLIWTEDDKLQPVRWARARRIQLVMGDITPLTPVRIAAGAFGQGPDQDLIVSQQHRLLIQGAEMELLFAEPETLVAAKHLVGTRGISFATDLDHITYVHFMFDQHQIVTSNGIKSESFFPGQVGLGTLDNAARAELFTLFPQLAQNTNLYGPPARPALTAYEAAVFQQSA